MLSDFSELGVATKLLVVLGPILFLIALTFSVRALEFSWPNIAVIGIAMIALLLPSIQKLSVSKDSVSLELFQKGVEPTRDALSALQKANEENSRALTALRETITDIKTQYAELLAKQNTAIATLVNKGDPTRTAANPSSEQKDLTKIQEDLSRIQGGLAQKLEQAQTSIQSAGPNNEVARSKIRDIDAVLRSVK